MTIEVSETLGESPWHLSHPSAGTNPFRVGAGLENLGNTCFLNAVLQCFTHTVPLVQSLRSLDHATPCRRDGGFCVLCALRDHVEHSLASSGWVISPLKLVENLSYLSYSFQRFQQEDAHELLQCMLDKLCSCVELGLHGKPLSSPDNSFVNQIFGGRLRSRLKCCNCGHCSDTFEPFIDMSLEIESVDTLSASLESFTNVEKIGDVEAKFTCGNCKEEVYAEKQLTIDQAPAVSVMHLKRFKSDGLYVEKINKFVKFPLELDLQPFISNPSGDYNGALKYDLYAVLVHIGISSYSGHYFSFIRSAPDSWYILDDSKVDGVSEDDVLNQEAYILFYKRQGSPWFLSLMEAQKTCLNFINAITSPISVLVGVDSVAVPSSSGDGCYSSEADEAIDAPSTPPPKSSSPDIPTSPPKSFSLDLPTSPPKCSSRGILLKESTCKDYLTNKILSPFPKCEVSERHTLREITYQIPHVHLKSEEEWERPANKVLEDGIISPSLNTLLRGIPNSRRSQLLACIFPQSEGSMNRTKRQRMMYDSQEEARPSCLSLDIHNHKSVMQGLSSPKSKGSMN